MPILGSPTVSRQISAGLLRAASLIALAALALSPLAYAQYKVVEPDGRVVYTDRPPPAGKAQPLRLSTGESSAPGASQTETLPYELRQVAGRFPVTMYTAASCSACDQARSYLRQRGIPFTEKTISTPADTRAWEQLALGSEVPVLRIGQQVHRGFPQGSVASDLDLAGYPPSSRLPASYRGWEPSSLAAAAPPALPSPPPAPKRVEPAPLPPQEPAPGGIRF